jgi:hypothetical protein
MQWAEGAASKPDRRPLVHRIFLDLVGNTNTHAARTRTGTHEAYPP